MSGLFFGAVLLLAAEPAGTVRTVSTAAAEVDLSKRLARIEKEIPRPALDAVLAAPEDQLDRFLTGDMAWRLWNAGALKGSRVVAHLGRHEIGEPERSWLILSAYRRRGRGAPLDLDALTAQALARKQRREEQARERRTNEAAAGRIVIRDELRIFEELPFAPGSAALDDDAKPLLDALAGLVSSDVALLELRGRAAPGEREPIALGLRRAEAVRAALMERGVPPEGLVTSSAGSATETGRLGPAPNAGRRRVELLVLQALGPRRQ